MLRSPSRDLNYFPQFLLLRFACFNVFHVALQPFAYLLIDFIRTASDASVSTHFERDPFPNFLLDVFLCHRFYPGTVFFPETCLHLLDFFSEGVKCCL